SSTERAHQHCPHADLVRLANAPATPIRVTLLDRSLRSRSPQWNSTPSGSIVQRIQPAAQGGRASYGKLRKCRRLDHWFATARPLRFAVSTRAKVARLR